MDLVAGVGRVVVVMDHTSKHGRSEVLRKVSKRKTTGKDVVGLGSSMYRRARCRQEGFAYRRTCARRDRSRIA